ILSAEEVRPVFTVTRADKNERQDMLAAAARYRFVLAKDPAVRAELFDLGDGKYTLMILLHYIAGDGWSLNPLMRDLSI
ncbi:condensation domain-containing protein, partial [Lysinibacillus sp. D4A1_S13]|uniref:condensation domain-containing protein n=1 Tax=Lysinibacillus sp. D4A1_S13 TaxID=2941228 RepID=UPI0020BE153A